MTGLAWTRFFEPGSEILLARDTDEPMASTGRSPEELARIGQAARERTLGGTHRRRPRPSKWKAFSKSRSRTQPTAAEVI